MVKNYLAKHITNIDYSTNDQIWLKLRCVPNVSFGFCYIPPDDSEYFTQQSFAAIRERVSDGDCQYIIMGDLNCKFGKYVRELPALSDIPNAHSYEYPILPDCVNNPNDNAYVLSTICIDNKLLVLNNLKLPTNYFRSEKTYRKGRNWISELDVCLVSCEAISKVKSFRVHNMESLPSDHAPISIDVEVPPISTDCLYKRACHLGGHVSLISSEERDPLVRRPIKFSQVINDTFLVNVNSLDVSNYENVNDVNNFAQISPISCTNV